MIHVCCICMSRRGTLSALSNEHREIVESVVSAALNLTELRSLALVACQGCRRLLESVKAFRKMALSGMKELLKLYSMQKKISEPPPAQVFIKDEPSDTSLLQAHSYIRVHIDPENPKKMPEPIIIKRDVLRSPVPDATGKQTDIEDLIPANTLKNDADEEVMIKEESTDSADSDIEEFFQKDMKQETQSVSIKRTATARNTVTSLPKASAALKIKPQSTVAKKSVTLPTARTVKLVSSAARSLVLRALPSGSKVTTLKAGLRLRPNIMAALPKLTPRPNPVIPAPTFAMPALPVKTEIKKLSTPTPKVVDTKTHESAPKNTERKQWYLRVLPEQEMLASLESARAEPSFVAARYRCESCVLVFERESDMHAHAVLHLPMSGAFPCGVCGRRARTPRERAAHEAAHATRYCCCRCAFAGARLPDVHAHECRPEPIPPRKKVRYVRDVKCKICNSKYRNEGARDKHMERMHKDDHPYTCTVCNKELRCRSLYKVHMDKHKAKEKTDVDSFNPELYCKECEVQFQSKLAKRQHMKIRKHFSEKDWEYQCDICKKMFPTKFKVSHHIQAWHLKQLQVKCDKCDKVCMTPGILRTHKKSHAPKERRYVCHLCGKGFTIKKSLTDHLFMHQGLRPHVCTHCPATFTYKSALYIHNQLKHLKKKRQWKKKPKKKPPTAAVTEAVEEAMEVEVLENEYW